MAKPSRIVELEIFYNIHLNEIPSDKDIIVFDNRNSYQLDQYGRVTALSIPMHHIKDISRVSNLKHLRILNLSFNQIENIAPLSELQELEELHLNSNTISDVRPLASLRNLRVLFLSRNHIQNLEGLSKLVELQTLALEENNISNLKHLVLLARLEELVLSNNQISDIRPLSKLSTLQILWLQGNSISNIQALSKLNSLIELRLDGNLIKDIRPIAKMINLKKIRLDDNQIEDIQPLINLLENGLNVTFNDDLEGITLYNNPLVFPPIEVVEQGNHSIISFLKKIGTEGSESIIEAKVTLVGEGNAGKTTLLRRLLDPKAALPDEIGRTRGISIADWEFTVEHGKKCIAHIWDFGGQDVYYPVHRFFLTENSVFVLLASTRQNSHEFNYWIPTIFQFGGKSPIILAQTCHDGNAVPWNDIGAFVSNDHFNIVQDSGKRYHELNLLKDNQGLEGIRASIIHQILHLPHIQKIVPASWIPVRQLVKELQETNCIAFAALREKIHEAQPDSFQTKEDIEDCIQFFHAIGILLWYRHEIQLKDWVILNPKWAVDAVYKIIDDEAIQQQKGIIYAQDFTRIWHENMYDHKQEILKQMLQVFKIAFPKKSNARDFIIPTRLESMPSEAVWEDPGSLRMEYNFEFMPKGMVNQVSAELSRYIIDDQQIWNNGVNFKHDRAKAQVMEDFYFRKISVKSTGDDARALMLIIMNAIKDISDGYKGVVPKISIPCPCTECAKRVKPEYFEYEDLLEKLEKKPNAIITCRKSDEVFEINELLSTQGLPNPVKERREMEEVKAMKTIKIFLASSNEMSNERDQFRLFISNQNDRLHEKGIYLKIIEWKHYFEEINLTGKQKQLSEEIKDCQMVLCLFSTRVGKFTEEEFNTAFEVLKENPKLKIYTYFENKTIRIGDLKKEEINSLFDFKEKLTGLGHVIFDYENSDQLQNKFKGQLERYLEGLVS